MAHPLQTYLSHYRLNRLWNIYQKAVAEGDIRGLQVLGLSELGRRRQWLGFTNMYVPKMIGGTETQVSERLSELWLKVHGKDVAAMKKEFNTSNSYNIERQVFDLGMALLYATKTARVTQMQELLDAGVPINFQHPETKQTALHIAAGCASKGIVDLLVNTQKCDFLVQDMYVRLPWDMAHFFSQDPKIERLLLEKTKAQARRESIDLLAEHRKKLSKWAHQDWYYSALNNKYGNDEDGMNLVF